MTQQVPVFLSAIEVDATNSVFTLTEGGVDYGVGISSGSYGTYYLRGDGAADDFCKLLADTMSAAGPTNTYTVGVQYNMGSGVTGNITITRTVGAASWRLRLGLVTTTLPAAWIGLPASDTSTANTSLGSSLSPSVAWAASSCCELDKPVQNIDIMQVRRRSRGASGRKRGEAAADRMLTLKNMLKERTHAEENTADFDRGFDRFLALCADTRPVEYHRPTPVSAVSTQLNTLSSSTLKGVYTFEETILRRFDPERLSIGTPMFSWNIELQQYVAG